MYLNFFCIWITSSANTCSGTVLDSSHYLSHAMNATLSAHNHEFNYILLFIMEMFIFGSVRRCAVRGSLCNRTQYICCVIMFKITTYRVSQEECARLRESVPYVKVYRYNPKHRCPKLKGYGDNGKRSLKL